MKDPSRPNPPASGPPPKPTPKGAPEDKGLLDAADFWAAGEEERGPGPKPPRTQPQQPKAPSAIPAARPIPANPAGQKPYRPVLRPLLAERPPLTGQKTTSPRFAKRWAWVAGALALLAIGVVLALVLWPSSRRDRSATLAGGRDARETTHATSAEPSPPAGAHAPQNSPAQPPGRTGKLSVSSEPPEAHVVVDDEKRGVSPLVLTNLPLGKPLSILLELEGYRPWTETLTLSEENRAYEIIAGLVKDAQCLNGTGMIYVISTPSGATIELDGKRLPGKTPQVIDRVCTGENHEIRVQAAGHIAQRQVVQVGPDQVTNLSFSLKK